MPSIATGPSRLGVHWLAIPAASSIILFLGYSSQWLFQTASYLDPGPLTAPQLTIFNGLLVCLWWTYLRACTVDPGRYTFPSSRASEAETVAPRTEKPVLAEDEPRSRSRSSSSSSSSHTPTSSIQRWCKKCSAPKPPRAHHCKHCARCVPKMDHHCPWTGNCVSMQTFPYFLRFVVFTNISLWTLGYFLLFRFLALWDQRNMPAYLGPTLPELVHLTILGLVCSATTIVLGIMLFTTLSSWIFNTTMIESWEIERHDTVVARHNSTAADGTFWDEDDDSSDGDPSSESEDGSSTPRPPKFRIHFPYDIGIFENMAQAMGTVNFFLWLYPFAGGPKVAAGGTGTGWDWPENGFNDKPGMWPPPDPDKMRQAAREAWATNNSNSDNQARLAAASGRDGDLAPPSGWQTGTPEEEKAAFQSRQAADFRRRRRVGEPDGANEGLDGKPGWTNSDGDRLRDYGVDEEADENEDDVPLGELLRRRKKGQ